MEEKRPLVHSTAGAVPIKNMKGELTMEKVKVLRYVAGKRPEYAQSSSDEDEDDLVVAEPAGRGISVAGAQGDEGRLLADDLEEESDDSVDEEEAERRRQLLKLRSRERETEEQDEEEEEEERPQFGGDDMSGESDEDEVDEEAVERRRELLRSRARQRAAEEELLKVEEEEIDEEEEVEEEESSEYEEYSDSDDDVGPRLKPVFVRKSDRVTVAEAEEQRRKQEATKAEAKKLSEQRKRDSRKLVEEVIQDDLKQETVEHDDTGANIVTDDDLDEEAEYESWKVRELKRIKRDREQRDQPEKERAEWEKVRNMTEDERRDYFRLNPKIITNKIAKGKYKFLQKYFHRGAFYLDEENSTFKQDFSQPTLEDHFDKTTLPKVMQVKNFGRCGRTKYTHLVDQDTTSFDSPWAKHNPMNMKIQASGGGMKKGFEKPSAKRKKLT